MKFTKPDFVLMRWNILALCSSLALGATALFISGKYTETAQKEMQVAQSQLNEARSQLNTAREDQKNMAIYADEFGALRDGKIIGDEHRLDWMEGLEGLRQRNLVLDFRYSIAPQKIFAPQPPVDSGNFDIHYSEMKLQLDVLHEGQLLDFFSALRKQVKGRYQLEGCTLIRTGASESVEAAKSLMAHLKADCVGGWITLNNRNSPR